MIAVIVRSWSWEDKGKRGQGIKKNESCVLKWLVYRENQKTRKEVGKSGGLENQSIGGW